MASSARRDPVRELAQLVRAPEPGTSNLGEFLADNASELAQVLGLPAGDFEAARILDDEEVAPRIRQLLERARDRQVQQDLQRRRERSLAAAASRRNRALADLGAELDVDLLLGELLADRTMKWVAFHEPAGFRIAIPRHLIAAAVPLRRLHMDLAACINETGLHFRWRGGRGGYHWRPHEVHPSFAYRVLNVPLAPKVVQRPPREGGAWVRQILQELGYIT